MKLQDDDVQLCKLIEASRRSLHRGTFLTITLFALSSKIVKSQRKTIFQHFNIHHQSRGKQFYHTLFYIINIIQQHFILHTRKHWFTGGMYFHIYTRTKKRHAYTTGYSGHKNGPRRPTRTASVTPTHRPLLGHVTTNPSSTAVEVVCSSVIVPAAYAAGPGARGTWRAGVRALATH